MERRSPSHASKGGEILNETISNGKLEILRGRLKTIDFADRKFHLAFSTATENRTIGAEALVNCIRSESNSTKIDTTFVKNLVSRGHIHSDELNMGIMARPDGAIVGKAGEISGLVYTRGTALNGTLWETTAIPEIRTQARQLALRLLAD